MRTEFDRWGAERMSYNPAAAGSKAGAKAQPSIIPEAPTPLAGQPRVEC